MVDPSTMALLAGGVSSLFGPKPKLTAAQKMQLDIAKQFQQMGNAVPLSNPDELAGLAQQRALLGNEQQQATGQVLGAMPNYARTNQTDMMQNMASSQAGERGALDMQAIAESIARNRQSLLTAGQMAGSVGPPTTRENNVPALMGQLATTYFQQQAMKNANRSSGQTVGREPMNPNGSNDGGGSTPMTAQGVLGAPSVSAGSQSGASGFLGAWSGMLGGLPQQHMTQVPDLTPPLSPMNQSGIASPLTPPGWGMENSNWNQIQTGTFGKKKRKRV